MRWRRIIAAVVALPIVAVALLLALLWLDHTRPTELPQPTGPFAVGRATYAWHSTEPGERANYAWVWYPADVQHSAPAEYMPAPWRIASERQMGWLLRLFLTRDLSQVRTHSARDANVSVRQHSYPVLVMRAGNAALTTRYSSLAEELASHGYVVVGFDAPYRSTLVVSPNGQVIERSAQNNTDLVDGVAQERLAVRLVEAWSKDIGFALDQLQRLNRSDPSGRFTGRLDLQRIGVFGHSLGGAEALQFCQQDTRCKAGADVDGAPFGSVVTTGIKQPFLFLLSDHRGEADAPAVQANIYSIYEKLPADHRLEIIIRGANHFGFTDDGALLKAPLVQRVLRGVGVLHLSGRRQIAVTNHYLVAFFDAYLKGASRSALLANADYPEVEYVH